MVAASCRDQQAGSLRYPDCCSSQPPRWDGREKAGTARPIAGASAIEDAEALELAKDSLDRARTLSLAACGQFGG